MTDESYFWSHMRKFQILVTAPIMYGAWAVRDKIERVYQNLFKPSLVKLAQWYREGGGDFQINFDLSKSASLICIFSTTKISKAHNLSATSTLYVKPFIKMKLLSKFRHTNVAFLFRSCVLSLVIY